MVKPLWALAGVALLGTAGVAGALVVASTGGEQEVVQQVETPTVTGEASATPESSRSPSPGPSIPTTDDSPALTPAPAPEGFVTYTHPGSVAAPAHSFAYPADWFLTGGGEPPEGFYGFGFVLTPWDPKTAPGRGGIPDGSMKLDIHVIPSASSEGTCPPENSEPATLGGQAAWQRSGITATSETTTFRLLAADRQGFRYCLIGYFADPPDPTIFDRIVDGFRFMD